jgi:hypothetical protein
VDPIGELDENNRAFGVDRAWGRLAVAKTTERLGLAAVMNFLIASRHFWQLFKEPVNHEARQNRFAPKD